MVSTSPFAQELKRLLDDLRRVEGHPDAIAQLLLEKLRDRDPKKVANDRDGLFYLGEILDSIGSARNGTLLLTLCDRLHALGYDDPIVVASAMAALVDMNATRPGLGAGGPHASLALFDARIPKDATPSNNLATAIGMCGRAHKDLFVETRARGALVDAKTHAWQAIVQYRACANMALPSDSRDWLWRWPRTNIVAIAHAVLTDDALDWPEPKTQLREETVVLAEELRETVTAWINETGQSGTPEPWNHATLTEISIFEGNFTNAAEHLKIYLAGLRQKMEEDPVGTEGRAIGTLRQFTGLFKGNNPFLREARQALRAVQLEIDAGSIVVNQSLIDDTTAMGTDNTSRIAEAYFEKSGQELVRANTLWAIASTAQSVARIETKSGTPFGTGFVVKVGDIWPHHDAPNEKLLLTNAHVCCWPQAYKGSLPPEDIRAVFEFQNGLSVDVEGYEVASVQERKWRDAAILKFANQKEVAKVPVADVVLDANENFNAEIYVLGHGFGEEMTVSMGKNRRYNPLAGTQNASELIFYRSRTELGHSGSPVIVLDGSTAKVCGLHIGADNGLEVNFGLKLSQLPQCQKP